jgi:alpha-L-rhamnosidase
MHRTIGGLAPLEPGYAAVRVAPRPGGGLTWARAALDTRRGRVEVSWQVDDGRLTVETTVPEGVRAVLSLEGHDDVELPAGTATRTVEAVR